MKNKKTTCKLCPTELASWNKSGYCKKHHSKSPQYLEYQREKQNKLYHENKDKRRAYNQRPEIKKKTKAYMKKYCKDHPEEIKRNRRKWYDKNKLKIQESRRKK